LIPIQPSTRLAFALGAAHAAAAVLAWLSAIPLAGQVAITLALAASLAISLRRSALLLDRRSIVAMEIHDTTHVAIRERGGEWQECELLDSTFVSPVLTIVAVRPRDRRLARHVVLAGDSLDAEEFRRLRAWLRWKGGRDGRTLSGLGG